MFDRDACGVECAATTATACSDLSSFSRKRSRHVSSPMLPFLTLVPKLRLGTPLGAKLHFAWRGCSAGGSATPPAEHPRLRSTASLRNRVPKRSLGTSARAREGGVTVALAAACNRTNQVIRKLVGRAKRSELARGAASKKCHPERSGGSLSDQSAETGQKDWNGCRGGMKWVSGQGIALAA